MSASSSPRYHMHNHSTNSLTGPYRRQSRARRSRKSSTTMSFSFTQSLLMYDTIPFYDFLGPLCLFERCWRPRLRASRSASLSLTRALSSEVSPCASHLLLLICGSGDSFAVQMANGGIPCTYCYITSVSYIMREVTKVFLSAHALLANGYDTTTEIALLCYVVP